MSRLGPSPLPSQSEISKAGLIGEMKELVRVINEEAVPYLDQAIQYVRDGCPNYVRSIVEASILDTAIEDKLEEIRLKDKRLLEQAKTQLDEAESKVKQAIKKVGIPTTPNSSLDLRCSKIKAGYTDSDEE